MKAFKSDNNKQRLPILLGLLSLCLGIILYLYDRNPEYIYFVPDSLSQNQGKPVIFGLVGYHLPAFFHVFAFSCISAGIIARERNGIILICLFWLLTDGLFEIAQHKAIATQLVLYIPNWFHNVPVLENTSHYLLQGRFDPFDLLAIVIGAICAYFVLRPLMLIKTEIR